MPVGADFLVELRGFEPLTSQCRHPALDGAAASGSTFTASCGYPDKRKRRKSRSAVTANGSLTSIRDIQSLATNVRNPAQPCGAYIDGHSHVIS
jgi:hypothetical protein